MNDRRDVPGDRVVRLGWDGQEERGPWLSPIGIFLVILGGLLLLDQVLPQARLVGSAVVLAIGIALLVRWAMRRSTLSLYAGAIVVALALPPLLEELGAIRGPGWGTLFLGIALLAIALIRGAERGGWGWQLTVGTVLAVIGGLQIAAREIAGLPSPGQLVWPVLLVGLGLIVILRGVARPR
ncbi:MAG TPA: hypothetical protein VIV06_00610 [Candidatus Limnocylindrales bacterium]